jgi:8-oxo-dGTP diphosphatase
VAIYLVRHAHAGNRDNWRGDDIDRPLSEKGRDQAAHLAALLRDASVGRVLSSPAARCRETAAPIAEDHRLEVRTADELREGADVDAALALLAHQASHEPVLVGHGDLIPRLLHRLSAAGMRTSEPHVSQKGSMWVLEHQGTTVTKGRYVPPA